LLRGIAFVQIPTTLLAMVDSSVGGKVAINSKFGKNLIGNFYQPKLVLCDLNFLDTLPEREFLAGYAEVVKYAFINNNSFFTYLENNLSLILAKQNLVLQHIISIACQTKANIVAQDELEQGDRALLNFGHSFAHIFETETKYSNTILHGEAVALGMAMAIKMSVMLNMINQQEAQKACNHLERAGFKLHAKMFNFSWVVNNLEQHIFKDKKNNHQQLTFILLQNIGLAKIIKNVDFLLFQKVLQHFI
jgi:3-dehydroquinate synthase